MFGTGNVRGAQMRGLILPSELSSTEGRQPMAQRVVR